MLVISDWFIYVIELYCYKDKYFPQTRPTSVAPPPPNENEKRREARLAEHRTSRDMELSPRSNETHTNGDDRRLSREMTDMRIDHEDHRNDISDRPDRNDYNERNERRHSRDAHHPRDNRSSIGDIRRPDHRVPSSHPQSPRATSPLPTSNTLVDVVLPLMSEVRVACEWLACSQLCIPFYWRFSPWNNE